MGQWQVRASGINPLAKRETFLILPVPLMKVSTTLATLLATCALLSACSKKPASPEAQKAEPAAAAATAAQAQPAPRAATYDPNLKPAEIVWDSPEKKAQWEARQAQLRQAQQAPTAPSAQAVQPAAAR